MPIDIRIASSADAGIIADMALALTGEIMTRTGARHFDLDRTGTHALCERLLSEGRYLAFLAARDGRDVAYAGLSTSHALYAGGTFGTIQEFYVAPDDRSAGTGSALLRKVADHGRSAGWTRLELCTPPLPEFERSLRFYERHGFEVTGGRKMKALLS